MYAAIGNNPGIVRYLIDVGKVDVNVQDNVSNNCI